MKVILNIDAVRFPLTGIGRYAYELARHLETGSRTGIDDLKFMRGRHFLSDLPNAGISLGSTAITRSKKRIRELAQKSTFLSEMYWRASSTMNSMALNKYQDHIYHSPNFYLPSFDGKSISTFHDLSIFTWPECHPKERVRYMVKELQLTIQRADALITDSEFTRKELADYFSLPLDKIFSVPLASSGEFYVHTIEELQPVLAKYNLTANKYTLFTGTIEPRKNITTLLDAYERLPLAFRKEWPLVVSGFKGWSSEKIHARLDKGREEGWLYYLGYTPASDLPAIFSGARLFVFPSLYEGFGLPVLEAMASGVPVISSNAASLPEVVGDVAMMFDPLDVDTLSELIKKGIEDDIWRNEAIRGGVERAATFSWQRCADETINVYQQV